MAVRPPDETEVAALASSWGMHPDEAQVAAYTPLVAAFLTSYDAVEELYAGVAPQPPADRSGTRPDDADNPLGAWYVRTEVRGAADGPLAGRTVAVKDNVAVAGVPMTNGSHTVEGFVPARDATVVTRLLDAGATVTGKSVCEDLCFSGGSHTSVSGPVRNPWDPTRTTGGSSSGSAALVAAGEVDLALGGDQGGSIRMPAAFCGIVGHKPTHGLVPYTGAFPIETTLDHLGPMTRTVADAAAVLDVLAGRDGEDPRQPADLAPDACAAALGGDVAGLRVGVVAQGFGWAELSEDGVDDTVRAAARRLGELGIEVVDVDLPWHRHALHVWNVIATDGATVQMIEGNGYGHNWEGRYDPELVAHYGRRRRETADRWSPTVTAVALTGRWSREREQGRHYAMAQNLAAEVRRHYDEALADVDLLVMPTVPMVARPIPAPDDPLEVRVARGLEMIVNCAPFDVSGHPATSVPAGLSEGLPVGMMLVGRRFADATCLRVAHAFEQLVGGFPSPPAR
ncbi:amidase [Geodermatophilus dictyosporus]|uniref:Amidase n=1 Tax=Geodermatophilus dictyosporus TaxID=1523247 RepID=A0A1I5MQE1_9ACTN|nr:amidase [Geodermatophilus dictyosporus]SFP11760.1 amidase [Geodermatophilus dictyosporus]